MLKPYHSAGVVEAGCDEAGRGCLAGRSSAAAVILPSRIFHIPCWMTVKSLSSKTREKLKEVVEREALSFAVGVADVKEIDRINILNASILAMHRAVEKLHPESRIPPGGREPFQTLS